MHFNGPDNANAQRRYLVMHAVTFKMIAEVIFLFPQTVLYKCTGKNNHFCIFCISVDMRPLGLSGPPKVTLKLFADDRQYMLLLTNQNIWALKLTYD